MNSISGNENNKIYYAGFDIGSDTINIIVIDDKKEIEYAPPPLMHFGNPVTALKDAYRELIKNIDKDHIKTFAFTGSAGKLIAEVTQNPFYFDTIAISQGADIIDPLARYIFHIGAKDPYFFEIEKTENGRISSFVADHGTGTKCGGGSGILINKQIRRFFAEDFPVKLEDTDSAKDNVEKEKIMSQNRAKLQEQVEKMHKKGKNVILSSNKDLDVGGRCGVIIQSDMIHMQNSGEQIRNILKGMYTRIARNYKSDVVRTRHIDTNKRAIVTGSIFLNEYLAEIFSNELGIKVERPKHLEKIGAAGAALKALKEDRKSEFNTDNLESVIEAQKKEIKFAARLSSALDKVKEYPEDEKIKTTENELIIYHDIKNKTDVVIGMDGGSTTTKALVADASDLKIIAEICLDTDGKPLETAQKIFNELRIHLGDKINIKSIAYTGSSGEFYYRMFTDFKKHTGTPILDIIKDEITCHANGVKHYNPKVDTIFECGGQDAKFTVFDKSGNVKKAKMNLCCMAGTGQSMKNMLDMLGFDFDSFRDFALKAERTPIADEMCAIFTEAGILKLVSLNFSREEIAAAIAYGFMGGYANKFVGSESFGEFASAQGGPFKGKACLAALALHTGVKLHAFPHRQLFGALGAAITAYNEIKRIEASGEKGECLFRGLGLADIKFEKKVENCSAIIKDTCGVRDCKLQVYKINEEKIYSGGLCPKGNTASISRKVPDYVGRYKRFLTEELKKYSVTTEELSDNDGPRILIPRALHFLNEKGVLFTSFFSYLGFKVVISPESDDHIANLGVEHSHSEACYPSKLQNGHVAYLKKYLRPGIDKIFLVNFLGKGEKGAPQDQSKTCPFISGAGFAAKEAVKISSKDALLPTLFFNDNIYKLHNDLWLDFKRAFKGSNILSKYSKRKIKKAVLYSENAQKDFCNMIYAKGEEIVNGLKEKGKKTYIGIGRGYTLFDDKANSKIHQLFASKGLHFIPAFFLKQPDVDFSKIVHHMYWFQGREMTRYNMMVALDPQLYGVRETNFNCGPDAMLSYHEANIFDIAEKPYLTLQTDGHNSNAQFGTRTLAFSEVVKNHKPNPDLTLNDFKKDHPDAGDIHDRLLGMPDMGLEGALAVAAIFRSIGCDTEVMPSKTQETEAYARKYLITNNCLPMHILFGGSLAWIYNKQKQGMDPNKDLALFIPMAGGPCRLGQYHIITRYFLDQCGFDRVPIINPAAYLDWDNIPVSSKKRALIRKGIVKSTIAVDVLRNAMLRTRPYELNKGDAEKVFNDHIKDLIEIIETGFNFKKIEELMYKAAKGFRSIPAKKERFPMVSMFGEIFVRSHDGANENSIKMLEEKKLEVVPRLLSDMFEYNNKMQRAAYWKERSYGKWVIALIKGLYMNVVDKKLTEPFKEYLAERAQKSPIELYSKLKEDNIFDIKIKGEAGISIGESYEFMNGNLEKGICGVYQLEPFGCMQECVATSKIQSLIDKKRAKEKDSSKRIIPYLNGVFGDSELSNMEAERAMFSEKCYTRKELTSLKD